MQKATEALELWLNQEDLEKTLKEELATLKDENEIYERFYRDLEFGTGGLRGILGAGTNRMNIYTVRKATQGFADYINENYAKDKDLYNGNTPTVAIAYDSRINSQLFASEAAKVFAANNIKVHIFNELMPTPVLSYAVRYFKCSGGVMITASHNPAKYNGYKAYNHEGCQLTLEAASEVLDKIEKLDIFKDVKISEETSQLIKEIPEEVFESYLSEVKKQSVFEEDCEDLSVVFSPLNGTGRKPVQRILSLIGVKDVKIVKEQEQPDGNFPTCPYPNPEKKEALLLGLNLCDKLEEEKTPADILIATDPDCDRIGIAVRHLCYKNGKAEFVLLTGNEVGVLLLDFICKRRTDAKTMPDNPLTIKTIVTTKMADKVASNYGVEMKDVLTGFKFIGEQVGFLEKEEKENSYIFGFEESYGYLAGAYVRDKDAVNGAMLICQMTAYYKKEGKTLVDRLNELYDKYGYYKNDLMEFAFEGAACMDTMAQIMKLFRIERPETLAGQKIVQIADYNTSQRRYIGNSKSCSLSAGSRPINLPKSNVLEYVLYDGSSIIARPSGTEPKLKIYISAKGDTKAESEEKTNLLKAEISKLVSEFEKMGENKNE